MEKLRNFELSDAQMKTLFWVSLIAILMVFQAQGIAGTDGTFDSAVDQITDYLEGSLGKGIAIGFILIGIFVGMAQQSLMAFGIGIGCAFGLNYVPQIVGGMFSAVL